MKQHESISGTGTPAAGFDVELAQRTRYESYFGGTVEVIEAAPRDPLTGATLPPDRLQVYYAHGAGWAQEMSTIAEMARLGRHAFAMEFSGKRIGDSRFVVGHTELGNERSLQHLGVRQVAGLLGELCMIVPRQQMREAATLLGVVAERAAQNGSPSRKIDAVFQSESAGHGLIAAYAHPEAFNNIVLAFPGSISGPQTGFIPWRIAKDARVRRMHRLQPDDDFRPADRPHPAHAIRMQLRSPGFREDAAALRYSALAGMLHTLRQRENAPGITLVAGLDDRIFELDGYLTSLVSAHDIDALVVVPGAHAIGGRKQVLATIMEQFPAMDARRRSWGDGGPSTSLCSRTYLPEGIDTARADYIYEMVRAIDARTPRREA